MSKTIGLDPAVRKAMRSVEAAAAKAHCDPTRPVYHFRPPANWMNDPNGTIFHQGYWHVFFQHNPYGETSGCIHWGHTRSRDLVHWEHLPIALWPSHQAGEAGCWSGCARINGRGEPMLFYTSVPGGRRRETHQQWAAVGDPKLVAWKKHPANPVLSLETHGGPAFTGEWRDPFIFEQAGRTFLVLGAKLADAKGDAVVALYEAADDGLARWTYRGLLYRLPQTRCRFFECPNFFRLGRRWVLLCSPYGPVAWRVGALDPKTLRFEPTTEGLLDASDGFYASNVATAPDGRCIVFGWVRGFRKGGGWNGCLALPRVMTLGRDDRPRTVPAAELKALRGRHVGRRRVRLAGTGRVIEGAEGDALEIRATFRLGRATAVGLKLRRSADGRRSVRIRYNRKTLDVAGTKLAHAPARDGSLRLHVFLDKSVMETFVDQGRAAVTRVVYPPAEDVGLEVFAEGGAAVVTALDVWQMKPIW